MRSSLLTDLVKDSQLHAAFRADTTVHRFTSTDASGRRIRYQEQWKIEKHLGQGSYGRVWKETCLSDDSESAKVRAVKMIFKPQHPSKGFDYNRELEAIAKFSHSKYESCFVKSFGWYESREAIFISMEFMGHGDLQKYMPDGGEPFSPQDTQDMISQVLEGLFYMHENGFAHRDLKPANILIKSKPPEDEKWWVKVGDFGISKRAEDGNGPSTIKGTLEFMAPEILLRVNSAGRSKGSFAAQPTDMWALGEITFRMLCGAPTFTDVLSLLRWVENPTSDFLSNLKPLVADEVVDFIQGLLKSDPNKRLSAKEAMEHTWMDLAVTTEDPRSHPLPSSVEQSWPQYPQDDGTFSFSEASAKWSTVSHPTVVQAGTSSDKTLRPASQQATLSALPVSNPSSATSEPPERPLMENKMAPRSLSSSSESKQMGQENMQKLATVLPSNALVGRTVTMNDFQLYHDSDKGFLFSPVTSQDTPVQHGGSGTAEIRAFARCPACGTKTIGTHGSEVQCRACKLRYVPNPDRPSPSSNSTRDGHDSTNDLASCVTDHELEDNYNYLDDGDNTDKSDDDASSSRGSETSWKNQSPHDSDDHVYTRRRGAKQYLPESGQSQSRPTSTKVHYKQDYSDAEAQSSDSTRVIPRTRKNYDSESKTKKDQGPPTFRRSETMPTVPKVSSHPASNTKHYYYPTPGGPVTINPESTKPSIGHRTILREPDRQRARSPLPRSRSIHRDPDRHRRTRSPSLSSLARKAGIPAGYTLKDWDPDEEPILLLGTAFDMNSLGRWTYDWAVYYYPPHTAIEEVVGALWLFLVQLSGRRNMGMEYFSRVERIEEEHESTQSLPSKDDQDMIGDFLKSSDRLMTRFRKILKMCEDYMWKVAEQGIGEIKPVSMGERSACEFVCTIFGRDRQLGETEKLMSGVRFWVMRFDANCSDLLIKIITPEMDRHQEKMEKTEGHVRAYIATVKAESLPDANDKSNGDAGERKEKSQTVRRSSARPKDPSPYLEEEDARREQRPQTVRRSSARPKEPAPYVDEEDPEWYSRDDRAEAYKSRSSRPETIRRSSARPKDRPESSWRDTLRDRRGIPEIVEWDDEEEDPRRREASPTPVFRRSETMPSVPHSSSSRRKNP